MADADGAASATTAADDQVATPHAADMTEIADLVAKGPTIIIVEDTKLVELVRAAIAPTRPF
jgi:hypothetical protein